MKKYLSVTIFLILTISNIAISADKATSFKGKNNLSFSAYAFTPILGTRFHSYVESVGMKAVFIETATLKGKLFLTSESSKGCSGISLVLFVENDGFGYSLYLSKEDWINQKALGHMNILDNEMKIVFSPDEELLKDDFSAFASSTRKSYLVQTINEDNETCNWNLTSFQATLKLAK